MPPLRAMWSSLVFIALILFLAFIVVTFFARGAPAREVRHLGNDAARGAAGTEQFCATVSILTNTTIQDGNRIEVLANGDGVYPGLWRDLSSARDLITWHVFWFKPGELAERVAEVLTGRARAGVQVLFLYDHFGTMGTPDSYFERLREAGVQVAPFRPIEWKKLYKAQQRMHARAVVIDGRIGYTGGFAIADEWLGDGRSPDQWRDTSARLEGPIVNQLQASFVSNWIEATGELIHGDRVFPLLDGDSPGDVTAGLMYHAPSLGSTNAERFFMLSIAGARERLYLTSAYFVPDPPFRRELIRAVERGVDVRVLTPGPNTDRPSTYHAGRDHYEELLEGGLRIYHYRPTMVHAKTLVADGIWSAIGTVNFDNRSMVLNDEVAVVINDRAIGAEMERLFLQDLEYADELDLEAVRRRGWKARALERVYGPLSPFL